MGRTAACVLLLLSLSAPSAKYVYIEERGTWHQAQRHCRAFHTDLAPVSGSHDLWRLRQVAGDRYDYIWIGLVRDQVDGEKWTWSGGTDVSRFFWAPGQPQNRLLEDYGVMFYYRWHDAPSSYWNPSFCYSVVVVRERRTWEEALRYCRTRHRDLASVASETEMRLIGTALAKNETTEHVWLGLRFVPGEWLWVDGQPMSYEAWAPGGPPACPAVQRECAALQVRGGAGNGTAGDPPPGGSDANAGVNERVWRSHDCEERFHFVCY